MAEPTPIPVEYRKPSILTGREIWDSPEPSEAMVHEVCKYTRGTGGPLSCRGCPRTVQDEHYGSMTLGCFGWAAEACRVMMAVQRREQQPKE
jgi:hypothetical protein